MGAMKQNCLLFVVYGLFVCAILPKSSIPDVLQIFCNAYARTEKRPLPKRARIQSIALRNRAHNENKNQYQETR